MMLRKVWKTAIITSGLVVIAMTGVLYTRDFRYNSKDGVYKVMKRGSDYTQEEREDKGFGEDYEFRVICPSVKWIIELF